MKLHPDQKLLLHVVFIILREKKCLKVKSIVSSKGIFRKIHFSNFPIFLSFMVTNYTLKKDLFFK